MSLLHDMDYLGLIPEDIPLLMAVAKQAEINEHKRCCYICTSPIDCKEILVKENELQILKDQLKEMKQNENN
jgi:hypothetical protein